MSTEPPRRNQDNATAKKLRQATGLYICYTKTTDGGRGRTRCSLHIHTLNEQPIRTYVCIDLSRHSEQT